MVPNDQPAIMRIRLPDEHVIAVMAGSTYKPSKIKMRALKNLIKMFENNLSECNKTIDEFYKNNGVIKQDADGYFSFSHKSDFEVCISDADVDYESFVELLEVAKAYKRRIALRIAANKCEAAIDMINEDMSLEGTSEFAQSVRADTRFMAELMNGAELEDEEKEDEEVED